MLHEKINELIAEAMKNKEHDRLEVLRLIKTEFLKLEKSEGFNGWDDVLEGKTLKKMAVQREDSIDQFTKAKRFDLIEKEQKELNVLKEFLPKEASEEDVKKFTIETIEEIKSSNGSVSMKDMKTILSTVQQKYPTANGKIVSEVLKSYL